MINIDLTLIALVLSEGSEALNLVRAAGITPELMTEKEHALALEHTLQHAQRYGVLPEPAVVEAKAGVTLPKDAPGNPLQFYIDEVLDRGLRADLQKGALDFAGLLEENKPRDALDKLETLLRDARRKHTYAYSQIESIPKLWGTEVLDYYDKVKSGWRGILTPWPTINEETYGFWPEDLIIFAARTGTGKCVAADTEIVDPVTGIPHTIEHIYNNPSISRVLTWSKERGIFGTNITAKVDTGTKRCLRFRLRSGRTITVTPEHPFLTRSGWQPAAELAVGDDVGSAAQVPFPENPRPIAADLDALGRQVCEMGLYYRDAEMPAAVFAAPEEQLARFLKAFWERWHEGPPVCPGPLSRRMVGQLQHLLLRFGIQARVVGGGFLEFEFDVPGNAERGVFWDEVGSIEDAGETRIYDLSVSPTACFLANDVIVHNTWVMALLAQRAWADGHKVLFGTTEISRLKIAMRLAALQFRLPYKLIRKGMLDAFQEKRFREEVKEVMDASGFYAVGGDFDFHVESYESAITVASPDLAILDGAYLMRMKGKDRTERAANVFDELKRVCKRTQIPNVITTQLNRQSNASKKGSADVSKIAMTDVAGWNGDLMYGLEQTPDMKANKRMAFSPLKTRDSQGDGFETNWDIDACDFSELPKAEEQDYSTGVAEVPGMVDDIPF